jgi:ATP-dependent Clp protease ATP-binding subunit ClpC
VENPLAIKVLGGEFKEGDTVIVDVKEDELTFTAKSKPVAAGRSRNHSGGKRG